MHTVIEDDERVLKTRIKAIAAVKELLLSKGIFGLSHVEVSRISGIGRATLYRHWPNIRDLALAGLQSYQIQINFPHGSDLVWDLAAGAHLVADQLTGDVGEVLRQMWSLDRKDALNSEGLFRSALGKMEECYRHHCPGAVVDPGVWGLAMSLLAGPVFMRWMMRLPPLTDQEFLQLGKTVADFLKDQDETKSP